ncbi:CvfB family protein [Sulfuriroseicoccus oceanibius]|uniref:GntR family transcriptional regulator n=1 Tax=Sulfuriroseicoccus oceanibius TaxID=2707525 RepID=A0A6B3L672_9BACT|nr:S1-like domain-containing RNA-binding protein [Sulfuriroseicoccus oceanibius]QQL46100.1 GntR family transcriptional regulator [Sulfuriroseicoccus oceanibius]
MITLGQSYTLEVTKLSEHGAYLNAGELGDVLLPRKFASKALTPGDMVDVFLYRDSEDRPVATTQTPKAKVGEFALLKVKQSTPVGAFLDWGLEKDLLVPFSEQGDGMRVGHSYVVFLYLDEIHNRITATTKLDKHLNKEPHRFKEQQAVDLVIAQITDLGFKAIINGTHTGILYSNEVFQPLEIGQQIQGYIKQIRYDGKIDLCLQGTKQARDSHAEAILRHLENRGGSSPLNDKSSPEEITAALHMSKKAFKKAVGGLYKQQKITVSEDGIELVK